MVAVARRCSAITEGGHPCKAAPLRDGPFCFRHSPDHREEAKEASRLGGQRRRREGSVASAYDFDGLEGLALVSRILEIALVETLSLDNSNQRSRTLVSVASAFLRATEVGEYEQRLAALEGALATRGSRSA